jgi:hypothetical protein
MDRNYHHLFLACTSSSEEDLPLVEINIGLLADQVGVSSSNTLDLGQGDHDLSSTLDVGVEETENVLLFERGLRAGGREYKSGIVR